MKEKVCLFKLNIHYITKYIVNNKKLVKELSTSHDGLCYKSYLHRQFPLKQLDAAIAPWEFLKQPAISKAA